MNVEIASAPTKIQQATDIYNVASAEKNTSPVLYFEFIDGELRPKLNRKMGFVALEYRAHTHLCRLPRDRRDLRLPEFTPTAITRLISKRNEKFRKAVHSYIQASQDKVPTVSCTHLAYSRKLTLGYSCNVGLRYMSQGKIARRPLMNHLSHPHQQPRIHRVSVLLR